MGYLILKYLHVLAAIAAVGANITYGFWIVRAKRQPEVLGFALRSIRFIDNALANPGYAVLLLTGMGMAHLGAIPLRMPWLAAALALYALVAIIGVAGYTPTLRRQIQALERGGHASGEYAALARRGDRFGRVLGVLVLAILFLMVFKPAWGA